MRFAYHAFLGRFSDSPLAIHRALLDAGGDDEHVWLADPAHLDAFPADVATAVVGTPEAVAALEACDVLIANTHTELEWVKRPDQLYLQTWHGTPLKRIHWDVLWAPEGRLERLSGDVAQWDVLLSPNAWSTPRLRSAFRFEGEVLETGYPRNDVLTSGGHDLHRARVRERLGIAADARVVLYAPTWRDDVVFAGGDGPIGLELDVAAFHERFPDDHLLLRLHYMMTGRLAEVDVPGVHDVSFHPDIAELYCAADVLVTDYSSVMFDWAVTGRPLLLFTYDLERFRDDLRGFYFDLTEDPPSPLLRTSDQLIDALGDVEGTLGPFAAAIARFRERFCHLEDGRATQRVLARLGRG